MPTFVLKLGVCVDCRNSLFTLSEETGDYDATINPNGWNGLIDTTDVDSAWLQVTSPTGNVYGPYDILTTFPNITGVTLQIDPEDITGSGEGEAISDGRWFFEYGVQGEIPSQNPFPAIPFNYRCTQEVLVDCEVACCVIQKTADADSCACKGSASRAQYDHHLNYVSMWGAWNCGKKEKALKILEKLQAMCAGNCKDC